MIHIKGRIQQRVLYSILAGGGILLILALVPTYFYLKGALTRSIGENFLEIALKTSEGIEARVDQELLTLKMLAQDPNLQEALEQGDPKSLVRQLRTTLALEQPQGVHLAYYLVDRQGGMVASARVRPGEARDQAGQEWWKTLWQRQGAGDPPQPLVGTIYQDPLTGRYAWDLTYPVVGSNGRPLGALRSVLDATVFFQFIRDMRFGRTGHGMILSSRGTPLVCSMHPLESHAIPQDLVQQIVQQGKGWFIAPDDGHGGHHSLVAFAPVRSLSPYLRGEHWYAFVRQDPRETFAPVRHTLLWVLSLEGGAILLMSLVGVMIGRRFLVDPLGRIQRGVQEVARGQLDTRVEVRTEDEIQALAEGFNRMCEALRDSYSRLEGLIQDRTRELRRSEAKYRALMEQASDALFLVHPHTGKILEVNQQAESLTGRSRGELLRLSFQSLLPPDEGSHFLERLRETVRRGKSAMKDALFRVQDGGTIWVDIRMGLILYGDGGRVVHCAVRDITERKAEEERLQTVIEQLSRSTSVMLEQDQRLEVLREQIHRLVSQTSLEQVLEEVLEFLYRGLEKIPVGLYVVAQDHRLVRRVSRGDRHLPRELSLEEPLIQEALEQGIPVGTGADGRTALKDRSGPWRILPLIGHREALGVVVLSGVSSLDAPLEEALTRVLTLLLEVERQLQILDSPHQGGLEGT